MNIYFNYQFNFENKIGAQKHEEMPIEMEPIIMELAHFINCVNTASLKETIFKLLMDYMVKNGEPPKKELKEIYALLEFLKFLANEKERLLLNGELNKTEENRGDI